MRIPGGAAAVAVAVLSAAPALAVGGPTVHVAQGDLAGVTSGGADSFKGVPFAAPPVGELRWRPPAPAPRWTAVRDATAFGPACLQPPKSGVAMSEDCLTLNVWTPTNRPTGDRLPVMVWIYGGAFVEGASAFPIYDGTHFAQRGVVLVSFNYRLGRAGFFAHPALDQGSGPVGDYGLMDQIAALKWVQANIAAFGGDPGNVTIFGESAGGISVNYLVASPVARGLFARAISESGFGRSKGVALRGDAQGHDAESAGVRFAEAHGIHGSDAAAALRALPADALNAPYGAIGDPDAPGVIIDGQIVAQSPAQAFAQGAQAHVPYLTGSNSYEASLFPLVTRFPNAVLAKFGGARGKIEALYAGEAPPQMAADVTGDVQITEPARFLAEAMAKTGEPVFVYHFSYVPAADRGAALGAPHGGELAYVFGTLPDHVVTYSGRVYPAATPEDRVISEAMESYWVAFAKTGDPAAAGGLAWPRYSAASGQVMEFGQGGARLRQDFEKDRLDLLESIAAGR
jgi:para-nitrobenzyl esterase